MVKQNIFDRLLLSANQKTKKENLKSLKQQLEDKLQSSDYYKTFLARWLQMCLDENDNLVIKEIVVRDILKNCGGMKRGYVNHLLEFLEENNLITIRVYNHKNHFISIKDKVFFDEFLEKNLVRFLNREGF